MTKSDKAKAVRFRCETGLFHVDSRTWTWQLVDLLQVSMSVISLFCILIHEAMAFIFFDNFCHRRADRLLYQEHHMWTQFVQFLQNTNLRNFSVCTVSTQL